MGKGKWTGELKKMANGEKMAKRRTPLPPEALALAWLWFPPTALPPDLRRLLRQIAKENEKDMHSDSNKNILGIHPPSGRA